MRAARRSVIVVLAAAMSVVAVPAYAGDDSPGLLDTVGKTVDSLLTPKSEPAPSAPAQPAGPVKQLTGVVDSVLGNQTSLSDSPLVSTVDNVLTGGKANPAVPEETPDEGAGSGDSGAEDSGSSDSGSTPEVSTSVVGGDEVVATGTLATVLPLDGFSTTASRTKSAPAAPEGSSLPTTSTLPDGGSPLTLAWLVLCFVLTAAGALVIRRTRTSA